MQVMRQLLKGRLLRADPVISPLHSEILAVADLGWARFVSRPPPTFWRHELFHPER